MRKLLPPSWEQSTMLNSAGLPCHLHGKTHRNFRSWWPAEVTSNLTISPPGFFGLTALLQILADCLSLIPFFICCPTGRFGGEDKDAPSTA